MGEEPTPAPEDATPEVAAQHELRETSAIDELAALSAASADDPATLDSGADNQDVDQAPEDVADDPTDPDDSEARARAEEYERMEARDRRTWLYLSAAGVVVLVVFMLGFWPVMAGRLEAAKQLDQAVALLGKVSGTVDEINKVVRDQLSAEPSAQVSEMAAETVVARRELKEISALLDDAMPHLTEDEQRTGELVRTAANARTKMLDTAPKILKTSERAAKSKAIADAAAAQVKYADQTEARANVLYNQQTALGVRTAGDLYGRASGSLKLARAGYSQAASAFPEADFSAYLAYIDVRRAALKTAQESSTAWLGGDLAGGKLLHKAYQSQEKQAAAMAAKLPTAPGRVVGDAFKKVAGRARDTYEKARSQAQDAEQALKR
jgi:hypothetical protein